MHLDLESRVLLSLIAKSSFDKNVEFLQNDEKTLVVPGAAVPVETMNKSEVYAADGWALLKSMEDGAEEVDGAETVDGFTSISSFKGLNSMQFLGRAKILRNLVAEGVDVMDPNNTYIDPRVRIGAGTVILPGSILRGKTVVGENCEIGPNAVVADCIAGKIDLGGPFKVLDTIFSVCNVGRQGFLELDFELLSAVELEIQFKIGRHTTISYFLVIRFNFLNLITTDNLHCR